MRTAKSRWDVERAAAWLRRHTWGTSGEDDAPPLDDDVVAAAVQGAGAAPDQAQKEQEQEQEQEQQAQDQEEEQDAIDEIDEIDEIEIGAWPALVAPFYD